MLHGCWRGVGSNEKALYTVYTPVESLFIKRDCLSNTFCQPLWSLARISWCHGAVPPFKETGHSSRCIMDFCWTAPWTMIKKKFIETKNSGKAFKLLLFLIVTCLLVLKCLFLSYCLVAFLTQWSGYCVSNKLWQIFVDLSIWKLDIIYGTPSTVLCRCPILPESYFTIVIGRPHSDWSRWVKFSKPHQGFVRARDGAST